MPGIAGLLSSQHVSTNAQVLEQMLAAMKHDASYCAESCVHPEASAWIGSVSRPQLQQFHWNVSRDIAVQIYGEFHTDNQTQSASLNQAGALKFFLMDYVVNGESALQHLNGWFSGVLIDCREKKSILFNDRYGLGRVYIHQSKDRLYFASEAKAILQTVLETRQLDERALGEWLNCGCVLQNRTLFQGISLLPPGSAWTLSADGSLKQNRYFDPSSWETQPPYSAEEYAARLKETFPRIVKPYLNGSEPVGMSLTGGLDGRMIMAWAESTPGALPCYTFNGPIRDCADVVLARKVAAVCGQKHQAISFEPDFFSNFGSLAEQSVFVTDGAMDVTGAAELYLNRKARQIAPVRLTGNYGSEILRRYLAFRPRSVKPGIYSVECNRAVEAAAHTYAAEAQTNRLAFIAFKQVPWHHHSRFSVEQSQLTLRSPYLDNELVSLAFRAPKESSTNIEPSLQLIATGNPALGRIPTDRGITYPAAKKANRLNREFQEFLAKAEYAYDYGMPDWLCRADRYLSPFKFERLFLGRQKFCHFRSWYRKELSGYIRETLLDPAARNRSHVNSGAIEKTVEGHIKGIHNRTIEIHKLLSLELIHRKLLI